MSEHDTRETDGQQGPPVAVESSTVAPSITTDPGGESLTSTTLPASPPTTTTLGQQDDVEPDVTAELARAAELAAVVERGIAAELEQVTPLGVVTAPQDQGTAATWTVTAPAPVTSQHDRLEAQLQAELQADELLSSTLEAPLDAPLDDQVPDDTTGIVSQAEQYVGRVIGTVSHPGSGLADQVLADPAVTSAYVEGCRRAMFARHLAAEERARAGCVLLSLATLGAAREMPTWGSVPAGLPVQLRPAWTAAFGASDPHVRLASALEVYDRLGLDATPAA